jgi:hypothetical protein
MWTASSQRRSGRQESLETKGVAPEQEGHRRGRWVDVVDYPDKGLKLSLSQLYMILELQIRETT